MELCRDMFCASLYKVLCANLSIFYVNSSPLMLSFFGGFKSFMLQIEMINKIAIKVCKIWSGM